MSRPGRKDEEVHAKTTRSKGTGDLREDLSQEAGFWGVESNAKAASQKKPEHELTKGKFEKRTNHD